jgi:pimeloyl-ACP methyl ester carboxylesterase
MNPKTEFYTWKNYRCAYEFYQGSEDSTPLLLIHPIGVGLSRNFWRRFCQVWDEKGHPNPIYSPDLLGCGESDMPRVACRPVDWAKQLQYFVETVVQKPVILIVQGALLAVGLELIQLSPNLIQKVVMAGPPAWRVMSETQQELPKKITWNLLDSPLGNAFYRYARREEFLRSFSTKQLFENSQDVDIEWLNMLKLGAENPDSRYAVFSFLAGFWRKDYSDAIANLTPPTLVVVGETASSISQAGKAESPDERLAIYLQHLPQAQGVKIPGRNVMPYETTSEFVNAIAPFICS